MLGSQLRQLPPDVVEQPGVAWALVYVLIFPAFMYGFEHFSLALVRGFQDSCANK